MFERCERDGEYKQVRSLALLSDLAARPCRS